MHRPWGHILFQCEDVFYLHTGMEGWLYCLIVIKIVINYYLLLLRFNKSSRIRRQHRNSSWTVDTLLFM